MFPEAIHLVDKTFYSSWVITEMLRNQVIPQRKCFVKTHPLTKKASFQHPPPLTHKQNLWEAHWVVALFTFSLQDLIQDVALSEGEYICLPLPSRGQIMHALRDVSSINLRCPSIKSHGLWWVGMDPYFGDSNIHGWSWVTQRQPLTPHLTNWWPKNV